MKKFITIVMVCLIVALAFSIIATPALAAGKGNGKANGKANGHGNGNGATITLDQADPHFGDWVTFTVATDASNDWVNTRCYQGGYIVYSQWEEVIDHSAGVFGLGPTPSWMGGAAYCVADVILMGNGANKAKATTSFDVAP